MNYRILRMSAAVAAIAWSPAIAARSLNPGCPDAGCFAASASGHVQRKITGKAAYGMSGDRLVLILAAAGTPGLTLVITRDSAGVPRPGQNIVVMKHSYPGDSDDPPEPTADQFHISVRGGSPIAPSWIAVASSGTLRMSTDAAGVIAGTFAIVACGVDVESDETVRMSFDGSFQAVRQK